jgi:phosphoribosyl-ATP pyrophosphohydrolase/phosphoribosyl-AMP cyclohydrolase
MTERRSAITLDLDGLDFAKGGGLVTVVAQDALSGAVLMVAHADRQALERTLSSGEMHYRSRTRGAWHKGATSGNVQRVVSLAVDCDGDTVLARVEPAGPACHTGAVSCFGQDALAADALGELDATIATRARMAGARAAADSRAGATQDPRRDVAAAAAVRGAVTGRGAPPRGQDARSAQETRHHAVAASGDPPRDSAGGPPPDGHDSADPRAQRDPASADATAPSRPSYTERLLRDRNLRLKKIGEEAAELVTACADADPERAVEEAVDLIYHTLVALRATGIGLDDLRRVVRARATR